MVAALRRIIAYTIVLSLQGLGTITVAVASPLYQDCQISWNANTEPDLAGYRLYSGRLASQLNQVKDLGNRTSIKCSDAQIATNGNWFSAVTAYDTSNNESSLSPVISFELSGLTDLPPPVRLSDPTSVRLTINTLGFQLTWIDPNTPAVPHRIEISNSLQPSWSLVGIFPSSATRFSSYQLAQAEWVCYRIRGEVGAIVSDWAQDSGPSDRQFCYAPVRVPVNDQAIVASTVMSEPQAVKLTLIPPGFRLSWAPAVSSSSIVHRIEISSSTSAGWTVLAVLPPTDTTFDYPLAIDATWVCLRIREEAGPAVSLWAIASSPMDRQFCFDPVEITATTAPAQNGGTTAVQTDPAPVGPTAHFSLAPYGFELRWIDQLTGTFSHRIDVSSSLQPSWTTVSVTPPGVSSFTYMNSSYADWICIRLRAESEQTTSRWALAGGGPHDQQFCYRPGLT
ncbi:hypothetical protein W02_42550 [Nitrospira sp. KM1]|uniref:hypothetical protein n=1 Tax=Nitrospira sp. KM1 TaxID=1936990 RepID=UPI0013A7A52E|nr:hypothetical protein [Nitrospira sp. KM1]BCA57115.1 hypothetical protein W02_42550 [Nitrospira sp. KM1]